MISERLKTVVQLAGHGDTAADIGTDHGFVAVALVESGCFKRAIAADINEGPLLKAKKNIEKAGLSDRIETVLSDGACELVPGRQDVIIVCGMGGELVRHIMEEGEVVFKSAKRIVLGPQSQVADLRRFLVSRKYRTLCEKMVYDQGKYYFLMSVVYDSSTSDALTDVQAEFGRELLINRDEVLYKYLLREREIARGVLLRIPEGNEDRTKCIERLKLIEEAMEYYDQTGD